ncbi:uncharacterized protein EV420DRAFT_1561523 [Desarmillaria tabescens]|uniref:Glycosyltransferase 61 catalytic domain-containing protein n=1 Tax=Armillaria tabescens TaxID=1929756 RepID=A0AA39MY34_ARMTA|nr:uncharacterized protein EV420DRAFT_1561523 [Desarmillaria tabescens]KAK0451216.1 hypothetical protein EV420DRAFT_1561523 [Desarmillaria tabescens]
MLFRPAISRRDPILLILGASLMHFLTFVHPSYLSDSNIITINTHHLDRFEDAPLPPPIWTEDIPPDVQMVKQLDDVATMAPDTSMQLQPVHANLPHTSIVHHAPGWTLFRNLYMSSGTLFILSSNRSFPEFRLMTSSGLPAENTPENGALREPTSQHMDYITPLEAHQRWGGEMKNRVWTVEGNTLLVNEPSQFLGHFYHLVAELLFGVQAFWHGAFSAASVADVYSAKFTYPGPPAFDRMIFSQSYGDGWRDYPGFNAYVLRAAFPSLTIEDKQDWEDRIAATSGLSVDRAWHFPLVLLTDRSASHRGVLCGTHTQRIASEAWEYMREQSRLMGIKVGGWWEPIRASVLKFSGLDVVRQDGDDLPMPDKVVITYISRQGTSRRRLTDEAHDSLVTALEELVEKKKDEGWELNVMQAERMSKDAQVHAAARTTILLGVHGNGLTHLLFMPPTKVSTVIEIFYPGGFAHDYHWTTRALGMSHFAVWNDTYYTHPNEPGIDYPEGFQRDYIPVHGPTVAQIIEDRIAGRL